MKKILSMHAIAFVVLLLMFSFKLDQAEANTTNWEIFNQMNNVPTNKEFTIEFSDNVNVNSVRKENIYVTDAAGNKINDVDVLLIGSSNKIIVRAPESGYLPNSRYTLYIQDTVYSVNKTLLSKPVKMDFYTTDTLDMADVFVPRQDSQNAVVYTEGTEILEESVLNNLVSGDYTGDEFIFSNPSDELLQLQVGQIMILPATVEFPNGWSKKIVSISKSGNNITFITAEPQLEEVISDIDISQTFNITGEDIQLDTNVYKDILSVNPTVDGGREYTIRNSDNSTGSIEFTGGSNPSMSFDDIEVYKRNEDIVSLSGSIELTLPKIHLDTKWLSLNRLEFTAGSTHTLNVDMKKLATDFNPIRIPLGTKIPIKAYGVAGASVQFYIVIEAEGRITLKVELSKETRYNVGIKKKDGEWQAFNKSKIIPSIEFPAISGAIEVGAGLLVNVNADVLQFTLGGIDVAAKWVGELSGEISPTKYCYNLEHKLALTGAARLGEDNNDDDDGFEVRITPYEKSLGKITNCGISELLIDSVTVASGQKKQLVVRGIDAGQRLQTFDLPDDSISFESENPSIAQVNTFGEVIASATAPNNASTFIKVTHSNEEGEEEVTRRVRVVVTNDGAEGIPTPITGAVVDSVTEQFLANAEVKIYDTNDTLIKTISTNTNGKYSTEIKPGQYRLRVAKDGYRTGYLVFEIYSGGDQQTQTIDTMKLTKNDAVRLGKVSGKIIDSVTGEAIDNVSLFFREGNNVTTGEVEYSTDTDENGMYLAPLEAGTYTVQVFKEDYLTGYFTVVIVADTEKTNQNFTISKSLDLSQLRVVLTWGETPRDLDLHLWGPGSDGNRFHLYYTHVGSASYKQIAGASLDRDDTTSYGPETITIHDIRDGIYTFGIHDYTNRGSSTSNMMSLSNAKVDVYSGESATPIRSFNIPYNQIGNYWEVFKFNGVTNEIIPVNEISNNSRIFQESKSYENDNEGNKAS